MNSKSRIVICGATEVDGHKNLGISHIIRIVNTGINDLLPAWFQGEYLQLSFGDVVSEADAINCKTKAPNVNNLNKALGFSRQAFSCSGSTILVTCDYGASRSPALAYVIWADKLGPGNEQEAFDHIISINPESVPNTLVVAIGDVVLKRNGSLVEVLANFNQQIMADMGLN